MTNVIENEIKTTTPVCSSEMELILEDKTGWLVLLTVSDRSFYLEVNALSSLHLAIIVQDLSTHDVLSPGEVRDGVLDRLGGVVDLYVPLYWTVQLAHVRCVVVRHSLVQNPYLHLPRI